MVNFICVDVHQISVVYAFLQGEIFVQGIWPTVNILEEILFYYFENNNVRRGILVANSNLKYFTKISF